MNARSRNPTETKPKSNKNPKKSQPSPQRGRGAPRWPGYARPPGALGALDGALQGTPRGKKKKYNKTMTQKNLRKFLKTGEVHEPEVGLKVRALELHPRMTGGEA